MPDFSKRSNEDEIMDDFGLSPEELNPVLKELDVINKLLGGFSVFFDAFNKVKVNSRDSISDWGCGSGDTFQVLQKQFDQQKIYPTYIGVDATPATIEYARKQFKGNAKVSFILKDVLKDDFKENEFDFVISSLFTHHFEDEKWSILVNKMLFSARKAVIINDLHRHPFAYYSIGILTQLFSKSPMVKHDSKVSVMRSFKKNELKDLLKKAGAINYTIKWMWAFRWQVIIFK
nr:methyltransferase domain-containing protein [Pseudopedobacter sp.]